MIYIIFCRIFLNNWWQYKDRSWCIIALDDEHSLDGMNISDPPDKTLHVLTVPPEYRVCGGVLTLLMSLAVLFGNGVLIGAVASQKQLRKLQNIYIVLLASTDILLVLSVKSTQIYTYFIGEWIFGETYCLLTYCLIGFYQLVLMFCTFLLMFNRAHLVASPWWAACMGKTYVVIMVTIGSIGTSLLCAFYQFFQDLPPHAAHFEADIMRCIPLYNVFPVWAFFTVVIITIASQTGIYVYLWRFVVKSRRRIENRQVPNEPGAVEATSYTTTGSVCQCAKGEIVLARTTLIVLLLNVVANAPLLTINWCKSQGLVVPFAFLLLPFYCSGCVTTSTGSHLALWTRSFGMLIGK